MRFPHSYLYQVKGSKNYYFRVRWSFFGRLVNVDLGKGHFFIRWFLKNVRRRLSETGLTLHRKFCKNFSVKLAALTLQRSAKN